MQTGSMWIESLSTSSPQRARARPKRTWTVQSPRELQKKAVRTRRRRRSLQQNQPGRDRKHIASSPEDLAANTPKDPPKSGDHAITLGATATHNRKPPCLEVWLWIGFRTSRRALREFSTHGRCPCIWKCDVSLSARCAHTLLSLTSAAWASHDVDPLRVAVRRRTM